MITIKPIVDSLLSQLGNDPKQKSAMGSSAYFREFRTIQLGLPRQCGKSTYLAELHDEESSLIFVMNSSIRDSFRQGNKSDLSVRLFRELNEVDLYGVPTNAHGLKYNCFLVDESNFLTKEQRANFYSIIAFYDIHKMLHKNFYVLMLTT